MKPQRSFVTVGLVVAVLLAGSLLLLSANGRTVAPEKGATSAVTLAQPPATCQYCSRNLVGKSAEEVGQFALEYAKANGNVRKGTPQLLLSRSITGEEYTALGLGCLPTFDTLEEPPMVLVILRGYLDLGALASGTAPKVTDMAPVYMGLVFDLWAAQPVAWVLSHNQGGIFRQALNDPALPVETSSAPGCPKQIPMSQRYLHYGQAAPGFSAAPPIPTNIQAPEGGSATTSPVAGSPTIPPPVGTAVYPTLPPAPPEPSTSAPTFTSK